MCNKEVILSAGAIASPQILELSGVGNPEILKKNGIIIKHSLSAVGENFQDHFMARLQWKLKHKKFSYNYRGRGINKYTEIIKYIVIISLIFYLVDSSTLFIL